jgi:hypothetical protein
MKICRKCGIEKEKSEYYKQKHSHDGYENNCKKCKTISTMQFRKNDATYKERHNEQARRYRDNNKDKVKESAKYYYENNKEKIKDYVKDYYSKKENYNRKIKGNLKNRKERLKSDPLFNLSQKIRNVIRFSFKKRKFRKKSKTSEIIGCSFDELKMYLESKFEPWMNWENRGLYNGSLNYGWDIDHIIPLDSANSEQDIIKLNHFTNLQPLCSYVNRDIKKNKLEYDKCN